MTYPSMNSAGKLVAGVSLLLALLASACQTMPQTTSPMFTVRVRHISDQASFEDHLVRVGDEFFISDTEYYARVQQYVPDFAINLKTKEVISRSEQPRNPALQLAVFYEGELVYETWVLRDNPLPHVVREPGYYFQFVSDEVPADSDSE